MLVCIVSYIEHTGEETGVAFSRTPVQDRRWGYYLSGKGNWKKNQTKSYSRTEIFMKGRGKTCQRTVVTLSI